MDHTKISTSAMLFGVAIYGIALAAEAMPTSVVTHNGMFTDVKGMSLYTADDDKRANVSSCYGNCLHNWPAFEAPADAHDIGGWKVIIRDDGTTQWSYKSKPVYYFILDMAAGDKKGDGIANRWHIAKP